MRKIAFKNDFIFISLIFLCILLSLCFYFQSHASNVLKGIEAFPKSYQPYLREIAKKYPNWTFTALYTNLDWNTVIKEENVFGKNLVPKNYSDNWKNTQVGQYNIEVDNGWVDSSQQAVEYCMDPRNFLNEVRIFQFEALSYDASTNHIEGIEKILYGTEFYQKQVSYLDSIGNMIQMKEQYADLILKAGEISHVSPYHLASRIKQEVGPFLSHGSISGNIKGYEGLYNFYNIGATSSSEPMGAIKNGLQYAKDGKGASIEIQNKYWIPWNNKEKAITGGAIFLGESYINVGQNTIYLQKFDVNDAGKNSLYWHQYMTNVLAPYSESKSIYYGYQKMNLLDIPISFIIPVYDNMPNFPTESPDILSSDFSDDNTKVYCNATHVYIRNGPSTSCEVITTVSKADVMTRIKKGKQSGGRWDKVILENGIIGYIYQAYVTEIPFVQIEKIDINLENQVLEKGESMQLPITILPQEASNHKVLYFSSNPKVATIDNNGHIYALHSGETMITVKAEENHVQTEIKLKVHSSVTDIVLDRNEVIMSVGESIQMNGTIQPDDADEKTILYHSTYPEVATINQDGVIIAKQEGKTDIIGVSKENTNIQAKCALEVVRKIEDTEIYFESPLTVNHLEITGIDYTDPTAENLKRKIITDLEIEIVNNKNEVLSDTELVGTGCKVRVKEEGKTLKEYQIILYGDTNGDGKITSVDLLVLQRHILQIEEMDSIFRKASSIHKKGEEPTSIDLLLIQRHIFGLQWITQNI